MTWEVRVSSSRGVPYYYNTETRASVWDPPKGLSESELANLPGADLTKQVTKVRASHLLVKHKDSRRPASWQDSNITRSKDEAITILKGYQQQIDGNPEKFAELAGLHSDCSSHSSAGDLGLFGPGQMQKPFEDGAFALQVGQISDIVDTDSGVHLIMRTA